MLLSKEDNCGLWKEAINGDVMVNDAKVIQEDMVCPTV
jgi:hypothetical protein